MNYEYHHVGIPVTEPRENERYSPVMDMYTSGGDLPGRIQYHRFGPNCPLHESIQTKPHVAYKVDSIDEVIKGKHVLYGPYCPLKNFRVAIVEEHGAIIEFVETTLTEEEIWDETKHQDSVLYPENK